MCFDDQICTQNFTIVQILIAILRALWACQNIECFVYLWFCSLDYYIPRDILCIDTKNNENTIEIVRVFTQLCCYQLCQKFE